MSEDLVEEIARVLHESQWGDGSWTEASRDGKCGAEIAARAVLASEPVKKLVEMLKFYVDNDPRGEFLLARAALAPFLEAKETVDG